MLNKALTKQFSRYYSRTKRSNTAIAATTKLFRRSCSLNTQLSNKKKKNKNKNFRFTAPTSASSSSSTTSTTSDEQMISSSTSLKLKALREEMINENISAFIIPSQDAHFSEYVSKCFERRRYISDFTGSAGCALVTKDEAFLWTDGRYFLQAEQELTKEWTLMKQGEKDVPDVKKWVRENMESGSVLGIDPNIHSVKEAEELENIMRVENKGSIKKCEKNIVDVVWEKEVEEVRRRPGMPKAPLRVHSLAYAGQTCEDKIESIRKDMVKEKVECLVVTALDDIMWLMNIRGGDAECNPVCLSHALITKDAAILFVDKAKVNAEVSKHLTDSGVEVKEYEEMGEHVRKMAQSGSKIWIDEDKVSIKTFDDAMDGIASFVRPSKVPKILDANENENNNNNNNNNNNSDKIRKGVSPIPMAKAIKNDKELDGMREAHLMDGVAMSELWWWLEQQAGEGQDLNEFNVGQKVSSLRAEQNGYIEESFPSIVGEGPHGAIVHYRATEASARRITKDSMLLLDSGGQFLCGTTDVTRTHHFGTPTAYEKMCYTRVLKGHIALDSATFPVGTPGMALDTFARQHLWSAGLDYRHGTGHGVGAALNVHEGPQSISPRWGNTTPIKDGMIVSNEPGYYEDGKFGIRIENLLICREAKTEHNFQGKGFLSFECLTFIPMQTKLMDLNIMSSEEITWVNKYHEKVWEKISPRVKKAEVKAWLRKATEAI